MNNVIIIVDDFKTQRMFTCATIKKSLNLPITLIEAGDGSEALEVLKSMDYKVVGVITDLEMPTIDGIELVKQIRKEKSKEELPVVLITSNSKVIAKSSELGFNDILSKPFTHSNLQSLFERNFTSLINRAQAKVLLVHDDAKVLNEWKSFFDHDEVEFIEISNAKDAWKLIKHDSFKAIISNYELPDIDGLKLFKRVTEEDSLNQVQLFLVTNNTIEKAQSLKRDISIIDSNNLSSAKSRLFELIS